ncbi:hypothetical protein ACHAPT_011120 [Fusarium lateritium]
MLQRFDGQRIPEWPLGLTINTAIALLSTMSRTAFVMPVSESVSQLKWLWYQKERPLADFQTFDDASRGPWGSLKLLVSMRKKAWFLGLLPAVVLTTGILTSTLTQSVVTYSTRYEPMSGVSKATVLRAMEYITITQNLGWAQSYAGKVAREIHTGLNYPPESFFELNPPTCATSECRWPLFDTLEVCTKTWNVTRHLNHTFGNSGPQDASLPNGVRVTTANTTWIPADNALLWLVSGYDPISWDTNSSALNEVVLKNFFIIFSAQYARPTAIEVLFHFCVNKYNVSISENIVSRKLVNTSIDTEEVEVEIDENISINATAILSPDRYRVRYPFSSEGLYLIQYALSVVMNGSDHDECWSGAGAVPYRLQRIIQDAVLNGQGENPIMEVVANVSRNIAASLSHGFIVDIQKRE